MAAACCAAGSARAEDAKGPPDLTGEWRLDPKHSDTPQQHSGGGGGEHMHGGGSQGGWGGGGGGGGWSGHGGGHHHGGGYGESSGQGHPSDPSATGARPARLPDLMHVTETADIVSFEDSGGAVIREVATVPAAADTFAHAPGADHVLGQWKGDKLIIEHAGPHDSKITETVSLQSDGKSLLIDVKVDSGDSSGPREYKRVYDRVTQS
jgi:hypothetical protein